MSIDGRSAHGGIGDAAGKWDSALLSAAVRLITAEVNIQVPVRRLLSAAAVVLSDNNTQTRISFMLTCQHIVPTWRGHRRGSGLLYHPLQGVDEVLQVDVVSVRPDVCQEEVVDPLSNLTLKHHRQHRHRQLQDKDEANHARKLPRPAKKSQAPNVTPSSRRLCSF